MLPKEIIFLLMKFYQTSTLYHNSHFWCAYFLPVLRCCLFLQSATKRTGAILWEKRLGAAVGT
jgi:hypothetical protein